MTAHRLSWSVAALMAFTTLAAQQPGAPPATFKVDINYVEVDAVVTNARGEFVRGLGKDDFTIAEDGRRQEISTLSLIDFPIEHTVRPPAPAAAIEPDVQTNARDYDGRLYVIVLDDLHTDPRRSQQVRMAARRFVARYLGPNDLAAVVHASGRGDAGQNFSGNGRLLRAAIDRFVGRKPRAATLERLDEFFSRRRPPEEELSTARVDDPLKMERGDLARALLETLRNISDATAAIHGRRKALILFSEGIDYDVHDQSDTQFSSLVTNLTEEAIAAATRASVAIYAVDPRGVTALGDDVMEVTELPSPEYYRLDLGTGGLQNDVRRSQDSLRVLAEGTGGVAAVTSNDYTDVFDRVVRESSTYYLLGYYPRDDRRDGRFRKIDVQVHRAGAQVRARKGYMAPRGLARARANVDAGSLTPAPLRDALQNPLPLTGLGLSTFSASFKSDPQSASVLVGIEIDGRDLRFAEREGVFTNAIELSLVATDSQGRAQDGTQLTVPLNLRAPAAAAVSQSGLRLFSRLRLAPGRYQLHLAALERARERIGSIHHDLEVPDFTRGPLAMSGLLLSSAAARETPTPNPDARLAEVLPGPPTTRREFAVSDALALFLEIYDNTASRTRVVDIVTTLHGEDGVVVFRTEQSRTGDELEGRVGSYGYGARIPVRTLAPGAYLLRVEARARVEGEPAVRRETLIRLVPAR